MLAGKRAAIAHHEVGSLFEKALPVLHALFAAQIEIDPAVHEAIAKMSVDRRLVGVRMQQRVEITQIGPELLAWDRPVLPAFTGFRPFGQLRRGAEPTLLQ